MSAIMSHEQEYEGEWEWERERQSPGGWAESSISSHFHSRACCAHCPPVQ